MPELDDAALERRLRGVLKEHLGALPLDLTVETLDRRREAKGAARRSARGRGITLLAAAALLLVGGALAAGSGILRLPTVVPPVPEPSVIAVATASPEATFPSPSESAAPSASPIPVAGPGGVWIPAGSMGTPRDRHDAVRLLDGRVLVVGGGDVGESDPTTAELYDPVSGTWSATGNMLHPYLGLPPTLLPDGRVLVGDVVDGSNGNPDVYGSELYDPATGTWSATGNTIHFWNDPAVVLADGRVLANESLYDPASGTWTATGKRNTRIVFGWAATLLSDGKVLAAGGYVDNAGMNATDAAEVYDPVTGSWTEIANMQAHHGWYDATLRRALRTQPRDGKVLVMSRGGSWEVYDEAAGTWTAFSGPTGLDVPRAVLSDGTVLMTDRECTAAAVYDSRTASLTTVSGMPRCSAGSSFTPLLDGTVLVAGGRDVPAAALYVPAGVALPQLPAFPSSAPPVFPSPTPIPTPRPTPLPPAAGPVPPNARSWTVTVDNESSEPAALFVGDLGDGGIETLVGSATPNVVPAGATVKVTFLFPANDDGWIYVNPRPGEGGSLVNADQIGIPGKIVITADGQVVWASP